MRRSSGPGVVAYDAALPPMPGPNAVRHGPHFGEIFALHDPVMPVSIGNDERNLKSLLSKCALPTRISREENVGGDWNSTNAYRQLLAAVTRGDETVRCYAFGCRRAEI
jgi:hypothetical protein